MKGQVLNENIKFENGVAKIDFPYAPSVNRRFNDEGIRPSQEELAKGIFIYKYQKSFQLGEFPVMVCLVCHGLVNGKCEHRLGGQNSLDELIVEIHREL